MSSFALKMIAIVTMLIDHIGVTLIPETSNAWWVFRIIGRISFPIFAFLIVEGFYHTRNVNKYLLRLGIFALVSEIPFDLAFYDSLGNLHHQNIFFTLFLGLGTIYLMSMIEHKFAKNLLASNLLDAIVLILACVIAELLLVDYGLYGIIIIAAFYLFRNSKIMLALVMLIIFSSFMGGISIYAIFSLIFIFLYNGKKGRDCKYLLYGFYPVHLLILYGISFLI